MTVYSVYIREAIRTLTQNSLQKTLFHETVRQWNSLCQRRGPSTANVNRLATQQNNERFTKSGRKGQKVRPYDRPYDKERKVFKIEDKTCFYFNSCNGCPTQVPNGRSCGSGKFGQRWMHVCNFYDNSTGKVCMEPHMVMEHKQKYNKESVIHQVNGMNYNTNAKKSGNYMH